MSLKKTFINGVYYTAITKYSVLIINLIITGILSRQLSPHEFGIIAIAMIFIAFFSIISDIGIGSAVIQKKELTQKDISSIFSLTLLIAIISATAFFFISDLIAHYYKESILKQICKLLSVNLFFSICNIVPNGLLLKNKQFKFITYRTFIVQLIGGFISIIAVFKGMGIYSLIINPLFSSLAIFIVNFSKNPIPFSFKIRKNSIKKIFSYSVFQFLFSLINYFSRNLDNILIGKMLGFISLGYYEKSYKLMTLSFANISNILTSVIHPVFSDIQNDPQKIANSYLKIIRLLSIIGFPLSVYLFFNAKELILFLFGDQWLPSIPILQLLSISIGFQMIVSSIGPILQATNSTKLLFIDGLLSTLLIVIFLFIGLFIFKQLIYMALFISMAYIINSIKSFFILFHYVLKLKMNLLMKEIIKPIIISFILAFPLLYVNSFNFNSLLFSLVIKSFIFLLLLILFVHLFKIYDIKNITKYAFR